MRSPFMPPGLSLGLLYVLAAGPAAGQELTLSEALRAALATHPAMGAAEARVASAEAGVSSAKALRLPSLGTSASLTRFQDRMLVAPLHAFDLTSAPGFDRTLVQAQVAVEYSLFEGGLRGASIRGADAIAGAARWGVEATEAELLEMVTEAYLRVLSTRDVQTAADRQVEALEAEGDRANRHLAEGAAPRVEVLRADAALLDGRAQATTSSARVDLAHQALARLMGLEATALDGWDFSDVRLDPADGTSTAVHPLVKRSRGAVAGARARVDQERAGRVPSISATAGLLSFGTLDGGHVAEWQAGIKVAWSIFTGGARSASIRRAGADLRVAENQLRLTQLQVDNASDVAEATLVESTSRADALEAAVTQWEEVARIEALRVQQGAGEQTDLLTAEAGLFRARAGFAQARYDTVLASVRLARARGTLNTRWMDTALEVTQ
jgi:outer membrane protein TolC